MPAENAEPPRPPNWPHQRRYPTALILLRVFLGLRVRQLRSLHVVWRAASSTVIILAQLG